MVRERFSRHDRLFFTLAGAGAAVLAIAVLLIAHWRNGLPPDRADKTLVLVVAIAAFARFHRFRLLLSARHTGYMAGRAVERWLQVVLAVLLAYLFVPGLAEATPREVLAAWALGAAPVVLLTLVAMRRSALRIYASPGRVREAVFLMPGEEARTLSMRLRRSPNLGIAVAGYFGDPLPDGTDEGQALTHLGSLEDAAEALATQRYRIVFIGAQLLEQPVRTRIMQVLGNSTASIYVVPEARPLGYFHIATAEIAGVPLLSLNELPTIGLAGPLKRAFDVGVGGLMLLCAAPAMLAIAVVVRLTSAGPVIFQQVRYGQDGRRITVYKFRSMYVGERPDAGVVTQATVDDPRVTPIGRLLRRTSLDELPQLVNVLLGDMSLVGPRPHAAAHNELYRRQISGYMLRHTVKPGITGWAQVNGLRGETDTLDKMRRRVAFDHEYISNWSLGFDIRILLMTLRVLWRDEAAH